MRTPEGFDHIERCKAGSELVVGGAARAAAIARQRALEIRDAPALSHAKPQIEILRDTSTFVEELGLHQSLGWRHHCARRNEVVERQLLEYPAAAGIGEGASAFMQRAAAIEGHEIRVHEAQIGVIVE